MPCEGEKPCENVWLFMREGLGGELEGRTCELDGIDDELRGMMLVLCPPL